jgi:hypothetical protein
MRTFGLGLGWLVTLPTLAAIAWPMLQGLLSNFYHWHLIAQCTCYKYFVALGPRDVEKTANQLVLQLVDQVSGGVATRWTGWYSHGAFLDVQL